MRRKLLALIVLTAYLIGFGFQERVKIDINYLIEFGNQVPGYNDLPPSARATAIAEVAPTVAYDYYYSHRRVPLFYRYDLTVLGKLKWAVTAAAVGLCLMFSLLIVRIFFRGRFMRQTTVIFFFYVLACALVFMIGRLAGADEVGFAVTRRMLSAAQSPFAPVALTLLFSLSHTFDTHEHPS